mmetsp:Transcript_3376/g.6941  ORF Transcript_3376/g.6941 Transcript_3376/m.6941 type:complete len:376 (+) Transcript_3376:3364-4491(+)
MFKGIMKFKFGLPVLCRLFLNYFQLTSLLLAFNVSWPKSVIKLLEAFQVIGTVGVSSLMSGCLLGMFDTPAVYIRLTIVCLTPFIVVGLSAFYFFASSCFKNAKPDAAYFLAFNVTYCTTMSPYIIHSSFSLMSCRTMEEASVSWLVLDYDVECYTPQHIKYILGLALPSLIIWLLFFPFYLGSLISSKNTPRKEVISRYLTFGLRQKWWTVIQMLTKDAIMLSSILLARFDYDSQFITGLILMKLVCSLQLVLQTHEDGIYRLTESACYLSVFLCLISAYYLNSNSSLPRLGLEVIVCSLCGLTCSLIPINLFLKAVNKHKVFEASRQHSYKVSGLKSVEKSVCEKREVHNYLFIPHNTLDCKLQSFQEHESYS